MSSASSGGVSDNSGEKNFASSESEPCPLCGGHGDFNAATSVSAEAQQGDGPAAASASGSAVGEGVARTDRKSVV